MNEYELRRLRNIERNQERLQALGIPEAVGSLNEATREFNKNKQTLQVTPKKHNLRTCDKKLSTTVDSSTTSSYSSCGSDSGSDYEPQDDTEEMSEDFGGDRMIGDDSERFNALLATQMEQEEATSAVQALLKRYIKDPPISDETAEKYAAVLRLEDYTASFLQSGMTQLSWLGRQDTQ